MQQSKTGMLYTIEANRSPRVQGFAMSSAEWISCWASGTSGAGVRLEEQAFDVKSRWLNGSMCVCLQRLLTPYLTLPHNDEVLFWSSIQVLDQCEGNPGFDVLLASARRAGL